MPLNNLTSHFNDVDLAAMQAAFRGATAELGIGTGKADEEFRDRLAALIVELAQIGERSAAGLQRRAVMLLREPI